MLRKEDTLINLCVHLEPSIGREEEIRRIIRGGLNWDYLLEKAKKEGVALLVYKTISRIDGAEKLIPKDILKRLWEVYYFTLRKNILIFKDLGKLLACFNNKNIKTIVFKGPALAGPIYKDIGLRPMSDVDILVKREDIQRTDEMLRGLGYNRSFYIKDFTKILANPYRNSIMYGNPNAGLKSVHLFWHIINLFPYNIDVFKRIEMDKIWKDAQPLTLANAKTFTFSIYHEIIYLCMHAFTHSFAHLILLCDINELLRINKDTIDWQTLVNEAAWFGMSKYLYYGLYVCKEILGSEVPDFVLEKIRPKKMSLFERRFIEAVLDRESVSHSDILACLGMNESLSGRIRYLKGFLFPPKDALPLIGQKDLSKLSIFDYSKRIKAAALISFRVLKKSKKGTGYFFHSLPPLIKK